jgi:hypothetical protein
MLNNWQQQFSDCVPVAHRLRAAFPDRWVRFHSLPGSKRYPELETDYSTILERHNCVLDELTGSERSVVLLSTGYSESPQPVRLEASLWTLDPDATPWRSFPAHESDIGSAVPSFWHVFASEWEWVPGLFDSLVRLVADDVLANIMVVNPGCRWLLHPYDGGMDVIAESSVARDHLKASHQDWLSTRPDGL